MTDSGVDSEPSPSSPDSDSISDSPNPTLRTGSPTLRTGFPALRTGSESCRTGSSNLRTGSPPLKPSFPTLKTGTEPLKTGSEPSSTGPITFRPSSEQVRPSSEGNRNDSVTERISSEPCKPNSVSPNRRVNAPSETAGFSHQKTSSLTVTPGFQNPETRIVPGTHGQSLVKTMCTSSLATCLANPEPSKPGFYSETSPTLIERNHSSRQSSALQNQSRTTTKSVSTNDACSSKRSPAHIPYPRLAVNLADSGTSSPSASSPTSFQPPRFLEPPASQQEDAEDKMETVEALLSLSDTSRSPGGSPDKPALITILPAHNPDKG